MNRSVIYMKDVTVACDPLFIPNLNPDLHKLICWVEKQVPVRDSAIKDTKTYEVTFAGKRAELASMAIKKGIKITLRGHFYCPIFIKDDGRYTTRPAFIVHSLHLHEPIVVHHHPFDYQSVDIGRYGHARVWIKGRGFSDLEQSKTH